jgi:hypothetical protein
MLRSLKKIEILLVVFFIFILFFTILYSVKLSFIDSLYTAVSFQTFIGNSLPEKDNYLKTISIMQMILSYCLVAIIFHALIF